MLMESLDTFVGLITVYLILSLVVTALGEAVTGLLNLKGKVFKRSIVILLGKEDADRFFKHKSIACLSEPSRWPKWLRSTESSRLPSYVPDTLIAEVIVDLCVNGDDSKKQFITPNSVDRAVRELSTDYARTIRELWQRSLCDVEQFKVLIADWFNLTGDRSVGWFRRKLGSWLFLIGLLAAIGLNADTLYMFRQLSSDQSLRESFVGLATELVKEAQEAEIPCEGADCELVERFVSSEEKDGNKIKLTAEEEKTLAGFCEQSSEPFDREKCHQKLKDKSDVQKRVCAALGVNEGQGCELDGLLSSALPEVTPLLGFDLFLEELKQVSGLREAGFLALKLLGWTLTAAAVSLGAPFWFDLLQKIVQVRSSLKPPATEPKDEKTAVGAEPFTAAAPRARSVVRATVADVASLDDLAHFQADKFGFNTINLFWSARLSKLAYETSGALTSAELEGWGAEGRLLERGDTQCVIARTPRAAFVSFRGTEAKIDDVLTDVKIELVKPAWDKEAPYLVHAGFDDALDLIWNDGADRNQKPQDGLLTGLKKLGVFEQRLPIWVSGHSLGGALAALASLRLLHDLKRLGHGNLLAATHTFGQPRVGDLACATILDSALPQRYFRSVNNRDVVPRVPLPESPDLLKKLKERGSDFQVYPYAHGGRVVYFNDAGKAMMDPPLWYRALDTLAVGLTKSEIKSALREGARDHGIEGYVHLHRKLISASGNEVAA